MKKLIEHPVVLLAIVTPRALSGMSGQSVLQALYKSLLQKFVIIDLTKRISVLQAKQPAFTKRFSSLLGSVQPRSLLGK